MGTKAGDGSVAMINADCWFQAIRVFFLIFVPTTLLLDILYLTTTKGMNSILFTEAGSISLSNLFFTAYVFNMGIKWKDVRNIFHELYKLTTPEDQVSYKQLKSDAAKVKAVSMAIFVTVTGVFGGYFSIPYIQMYLDHKKFPNESIPLPLVWNQWYPWDPRTHPYWEISILSELVRSIGMYNLFIGFDTMFSGILLITAGQFELLQKYMTNLKMTAEVNVHSAGCRNAHEVDEAVVKEMERLLRIYVKRHTTVINIVELIDKRFNLVVLLELVLHAIMMCFVMYQLLIQLIEQDWLNCTKYILHLVVVVREVFTYSYCGSKLASESQQVATAAFNSGWHLVPKGNRLSHPIRMIILRAQIPCVITACGFGTLSLEAFLKILGTAGSYFTLLKTIGDVETGSIENGLI